MSKTPDEAALAPLRKKIDAIDAAMVELLAQRFRTVDQVIGIKRLNGIPARLDGRVEEVVRHVRQLAEAGDCPPDFADRVWRAMIEWVIAFEEKHLTGQPERQPE